MSYYKKLLKTGRPRKDHRAATEDEAKVILEMYAARSSYREIARELGVTYWKVRRVCTGKFTRHNNRRSRRYRGVEHRYKRERPNRYHMRKPDKAPRYVPKPFVQKIVYSGKHREIVEFILKLPISKAAKESLLEKPLSSVHKILEGNYGRRTKSSKAKASPKTRRPVSR